MKRTIIILAAIICCGCSKMEIATDLLLVADFSQTRQIPDRDDVYEKNNFILRDNPTKQRVDYYFCRQAHRKHRKQSREEWKCFQEV